MAKSKRIPTRGEPLDVDAVLRQAEQDRIAAARSSNNGYPDYYGYDPYAYRRSSLSSTAERKPEERQFVPHHHTPINPTSARERKAAKAAQAKQPKRQKGSHDRKRRATS